MSLSLNRKRIDRGIQILRDFDQIRIYYFGLLSCRNE